LLPQYASGKSPDALILNLCFPDEPIAIEKDREDLLVARKRKEDRITLAGVKINARIGTTSEERSAPQECRADLTIWGDFEGAASLDSLGQSIDYCKILETVQHTAHAREYVLLETLAYGIVRNVLKDFPVSRANVRLRKRPASLKGELDFIEVEVEES
jgi:dihydroneopterin aldolase